MSEELFRRLAQTVIDGEPEEAAALARQALEQGIDPLVCINEGLTPGINRVGELFETGDCFLPELVIGAETMKAALAVLEPALVNNKQARKTLGRVVIGTVKGDMHDIGKTLVGTMLTAHGFQVIDLGIDRPAADFVAAAREHEAHLVGASALLTTTMLEQQKIVAGLREAGLADQVKVMVGGAPVTESWAEQIGADGFARDAISAVSIAKKLVGVLE